VIFPDAAVKVFLEASVEERGRRRAGQRAALETESSVQAGIAERDRLDRSRAAAPLIPAPDAVIIDTDNLGVEAVVGRILQLVDQWILAR
jgi:cytidylate kinase